ncbi:hypothetical protein HY061_00375 [Candidatus Azambacteria bacterium]|nr:hypothetical protein [Candidatus Azambacteria bacterium]
MEIKILEKVMSMSGVKELAKNWYGTMIKGVVDTVKDRVALGGDYHVEACQILIETGSQFEDVWGFNIRFEENQKGVLEFDSMVNIKPDLGNRSRNINDQEIIKNTTEIICQFIEGLKKS